MIGRAMNPNPADNDGNQQFLYVLRDLYFVP